MSKYIGSSAVNLSTTSADVTGNADIDGNLTVGGNLTVSGTTITVDHATAQTVDLGDGDKIRLGDGNDLQIYHDGSNSRIQDTATGSLILSGTNFYVNNTGDSKSYLAGLDGGSAPYVRLYYDGATRLDTTSTGVDITGTLTSDGLTVDGNVNFTSTDITDQFIIENTSAASGSAPDMVLYRNSASPADGDVIGRIDYRGKDDGAVERDYITLYSKIADASTGSAGGSFHIQTRTGATTGDRFVIGGNGYVGIGTDSPVSPLEIQGGHGDILTVKSSGSGGSEFALYVDGNEISFKADSDDDENDTVMTFDTDGTEAMRIDSSGNLLVGTTNDQPHTGTSTGVAIRSDGGVFFTRANADVLNVNRTTSHGDIALFRKDGSTVGSIGSSTSIAGALYIAGDSGLQFRSDDILPTNSSGVYSSGAVDLGDGGAKFRNLYLSGGVNFGDAGGSGTSSSNVLDSYEEGTFVPSVIGGTTAGTASYSLRSGQYTKIGNLVYVTINIYATSFNGTGDFIVSGLPYVMKNTSPAGLAFCQWNNSPFATFSSDDQANVAGLATGNLNYIHFRASDRNANGTHTQLQCGPATIGYLRINITYTTN